MAVAPLDLREKMFADEPPILALAQIGLPDSREDFLRWLHAHVSGLLVADGLSYSYEVAIIYP